MVGVTPSPFIPVGTDSLERVAASADTTGSPRRFALLRITVKYHTPMFVRANMFPIRQLLMTAAIVLSFCNRGMPLCAQDSLPDLGSEWSSLPYAPYGDFEVSPPLEPQWSRAPLSNYDSHSWIGLDTRLMSSMLDFQNRQGDKQVLLLENSAGSNGHPHVTLGAQFRASAMAAETNRRDKFAYLGRFPPDFVGNSATDARLVHANLAANIQASSWVNGYVETLFSDVFTFPSFNQGSFQMRQAYVVLGDLDVSPYYAFLGKKNVSFGDMRSLSPFSQSLPWHYFAPLAEGIGGGYRQDGWNATVTALNGSRGIRVSDSERKGQLNNFAANATYQHDWNDNVSAMIGAGYLHGTIYDGSIAEHINPAIVGPRNGAWDVNGNLRMGRMVFSAEYVQTIEPWPVVQHRVQAFRTEAALETALFGPPTWFTVSWGEGIQGNSGSAFEFNKQLVLGCEVIVNPNVRVSAEYVRSIGFAPLINITTVSDSDGIQNTALLALVVVL